MDPKDLRIDTALNERSNAHSSYAHGAPTFQCANKNKPYHDIGSNSSSKLDVSNGRPCAVIGPDRIVPPQPASGDPYVKKGHSEPWQFTRPPEYTNRIADYPLYARNISPRQTFQENMQRIMMPQRCDPNKSIEDQGYTADKSVSPSKSLQKPSRMSGLKYCEVPYTGNPMSNDPKCIKVSPSSVNPSYERSAPLLWQQGNLQPAPPYVVADLNQYPEFTNGAVQRQVHMNHPHRTSSNEPIRIYADPYYRSGTSRYEPYPVKDRYPNSRYDPINNYPRSYYPPFPQQKYDIQKIPPSNIAPAPYPGYPQTSIKFAENKLREPIREGYPRPPPSYNVAYHNQSLYHGYGPIPGNCVQNKLYPFGTDPAAAIRPQYDPKAYIKYDNGHMKHYTLPENIYLNDISRNHQLKGSLGVPNYAINMQPHIPSYPYGKKDNMGLRNYDYNMSLKNVDPNVSNFMSKIPSQFSPNLISPVESSTSSDASHSYALSQEDYGYVSQSSNASVRSMDSSGINMHRMYDSRYGYVHHYSPRMEMDSKSKSKKDLDVRQFLQMWNEGEEENNDNDIITPNSISKKTDNKNQELYVLGLVNVPREELSKYEHIQKVSKLPENIKGYTSLDILNQFEEAIESSNLENYTRPIQKDSLQQQTQNSVQNESIARPVSPLDVESKISQSVIHKEVGCNFEIKPCSPKMLNVEIPASAQKILEERIIEKVTNPLVSTPVVSNINNCNVIKQQHNQKSVSNDFKNPASCKLAKTQCLAELSTDMNKSAYSIQDLESISGVCLASLPRLDNDIELNFPEVNQQFIDANKTDSAAHVTQNVSEIINRYNDMGPKHYTELTIGSPSSPNENEFTKLSRYRKSKINNIGKQQLPSQQLRTNSVIIKNPESNEIDTLSKNVQLNKEVSKMDKHHSLCSPIDLRNNKDDNLQKCEILESKHNETRSDDTDNSLNFIGPLNTSLIECSTQILYKEPFALESSDYIEKCPSVLEKPLHESNMEETVDKPSGNKSGNSNIHIDFKERIQQISDISLTNNLLPNKLEDPHITAPIKIQDSEPNVNKLYGQPSNNIELESNIHYVSYNHEEKLNIEHIDTKNHNVSYNQEEKIIIEHIETKNCVAEETIVHDCSIMAKQSPNAQISDDLIKSGPNSPCTDPDRISKCPDSDELDISYVEEDANRSKLRDSAIKTGQEFRNSPTKFLEVEDLDSYKNSTCLPKAECLDSYASNSTAVPCDTRQFDEENLVVQEHSKRQLQLNIEEGQNKCEIFTHDITCQQLDDSHSISGTIVISKENNSHTGCIEKKYAISANSCKQLDHSISDSVISQESNYCKESLDTGDDTTTNRVIEIINDTEIQPKSFSVHTDEKKSAEQENLEEVHENRTSPDPLFNSETDINVHADEMKCAEQENLEEVHENKTSPDPLFNSEDLPKNMIKMQKTKKVLNFSKKRFSWLTYKLCTSSVALPLLNCNKYGEEEISKHILTTHEGHAQLTCSSDEPDENKVLNIQSDGQRTEIEMSENHTILSSDIPYSDIEINTKSHCPVESTLFGITCDKVINNAGSNRRLKRSLSESDIEKSAKRFGKSKHTKNEGPLLVSHKRKKIEDNENDLQTIHMTEEGLNSLIQNRRNSISSLYYDESGSFCILFDDDCIVEQGDETDTLCLNNSHEEDNHLSLAQRELETDKMVDTDVFTNEDSYELLPSSDNTVHDRNYTDNWVDDIGCVETVVSDTVDNDEIVNASGLEIALSPNDVTIGNCESPLNSDLDKAYSQACQNSLTSIYVSLDECNKNILSDKNKTLSESVMGECSSKPLKNDLLINMYAGEKETNIDNSETGLIAANNFLNLKENICDSVEKIMNKIHDDMTLMHNDSLVKVMDNDPQGINLSDMSNSERYHRSSSSSPEVSSTTSEDKKSRIRLKITNFNGSITSHLNDDVFENKSIRYKLTEETDYRIDKPKPLITKAAQKYIPPLKETIKDLKVKLVLPRNTLIKFKKMKLSKEAPKSDLAKPKVINPVITNVTEPTKKTKPNFEDVLKNIDVVQFKMHKERTKKTKKPVPKVVIKKTENGSHYTSNSGKDDYNPDMTGRKWQPWVFIEKNLFVDKMARKGKTKAIYCHKNKTYILRLPLNLPRYKHVGTNYEISRPKIEQDPSSLLKYTIRLKHN